MGTGGLFRYLMLCLILLAGSGIHIAAAADNLRPLIPLNENDVWRPGEGNYAGEFNRWLWENFGAPRPISHAVPEAVSADMATTFSNSDQAFSAPLISLGPNDLRAFAFGRHLFRRNWVSAPAALENLDGLGPTFNRRSCVGCHTRDGRGRPPSAADEPMNSMLVRVSLPGTDVRGGPAPHPLYGTQLQDKAVGGVPTEGRVTIRYREIAGTFADGEPYSLRAPIYTFAELRYGPIGDDVLYSPRVAPAVYGLGLLEAIDQATIEAAADPEDADGDGISGKVNRVWDPVSGKTELGRFGWKANTANLRTQVAAAAAGDLGITTSVFPGNNCPPVQNACVDAPAGGDPELDDAGLEKLVLYARSLGVPARRNVVAPEVRRGAEMFEDAGCTGCHAPQHTTGASPAVPELAELIIYPYTDLLLHDMGEGLADGRPDFEASGSEWRTPALWGIGLVERVNMHQNFLHDGRARGLMEAVLWHGGEAAAARDAVLAMPKTDRDALVSFLESL